MGRTRENWEGPTTVEYHVVIRPDRYLFISCYAFYRAEILDGDKSLVIKNVVPSDEGAYVCEAQNSVGQITSKAQLVVNCEYIQLFPSLFALFIARGQQSEYIPSIDPMFDSTNKTVQSSLELHFQHVIALASTVINKRSTLIPPAPSVTRAA